MEGVIDTIVSNPLLLIITVVLGILILYSVIKKLFKMAVILIFVFIIYVSYLVYTGQKVPTTKTEVMKHGKELTEEGIKRLKKINEDLKEEPSNGE